MDGTGLDFDSSAAGGGLATEAPEAVFGVPLGGAFESLSISLKVTRTGETEREST